MNNTIPLANPSVLDLAGQFGITDPNTLRMLELMSQQDEKEVEDKDVVEVAHSEDGDGAEGVNELLRENRELQMENEDLMGRIEILAAALGACPICWGDDEQCDECQGRGAPGAFLPDKKAFRVFVLPSIQKMQKRRRTRIGMPRQPQHKEHVSIANPDEIRRGKENE